MKFAAVCACVLVALLLLSTHCSAQLGLTNSSSTAEASSSTGHHTGSESHSESHSESSSSSHSHTESSSSTGHESSSTGLSSSSAESVSSSSLSSSSTGPYSCFSSSTYGNVSCLGECALTDLGYTVINNSPIVQDGRITSISIMSHQDVSSTVLKLKRMRKHANSSSLSFEFIEEVLITGLVNATTVQTKNLTEPLNVSKGDYLGLYSPHGHLEYSNVSSATFAFFPLDVNFTGFISYWNSTGELTFEFTLTIEEPCESSSSSSSTGSSSESSSSSKSESSSSTGRESSSSSSQSSTVTGSSSSFNSSSSSTGAAPPAPQTEEQKSITVTGVVVGAGSMLGLVVLVIGIYCCMKRSRESTSEPLLSHA